MPRKPDSIQAKDTGPGVCIHCRHLLVEHDLDNFKCLYAQDGYRIYYTGQVFEWVDTPAPDRLMRIQCNLHVMPQLEPHDYDRWPGEAGLGLEGDFVFIVGGVAAIQALTPGCSADFIIALARGLLSKHGELRLPDAFFTHINIDETEQIVSFDITK